MEKKTRTRKAKSNNRIIELKPADTAIVFSDDFMTVHLIERDELKKCTTIDDIPISEIIANVLYSKLNDSEFCNNLLNEYFDNLERTLKNLPENQKSNDKKILQPTIPGHKIIEEMSVPEVFDHINDTLDD